MHKLDTYFLSFVRRIFAYPSNIRAFLNAYTTDTKHERNDMPQGKRKPTLSHDHLLNTYYSDLRQVSHRVPVPQDPSNHEKIMEKAGTTDSESWSTYILDHTRRIPHRYRRQRAVTQGHPGLNNHPSPSHLRRRSSFGDLQALAQPGFATQPTATSDSVDNLHQFKRKPVPPPQSRPTHESPSSRRPSEASDHPHELAHEIAPDTVPTFTGTEIKDARWFDGPERHDAKIVDPIIHFASVKVKHEHISSNDSGSDSGCPMLGKFDFETT